MKAFQLMKPKLCIAPVIIAPKWSLNFQLMCDRSDHAIGAL